jgi:hypothetical protein
MAVNALQINLLQAEVCDSLLLHTWPLVLCVFVAVAQTQCVLSADAMFAALLTEDHSAGCRTTGTRQRKRRRIAICRAAGRMNDGRKNSKLYIPW